MQLPMTFVGCKGKRKFWKWFSLAKGKCVCIDLSNAYSSWVEAVLPKAQIVYGHFHVIKAMIEKMDLVRRRETAKRERRHGRPLPDRRDLR